MPLRITIYSPDRGVRYDGRTRHAVGVGGGITARLALAEAFARLGHDVQAVVHGDAPVVFNGVRYLPLDHCTHIDADLLIGISTGGALSFAPLAPVAVRATVRALWVQGVPQPADLHILTPDVVVCASNFLRDVVVQRWGMPAAQTCVIYNGLDQERFAAVAARPPQRDPFAICYIGPPEKGLDAAVEILRRLRDVDARYRLDVFGGAQLWGATDAGVPQVPGLHFAGLCGQHELAARLFHYEYCIAPQAMEEGFGIAVQEARRAGALVVASAVGAFPELIRPQGDGVLIQGPHDHPAVHAAFAQAILALGADADRRAHLRQHAMAVPWDWMLAARTWEAWVTAETSHRPNASGGQEAQGATAVDRWITLPDGRHDLTTGEYVPSCWPLSPMLARAGGAPRVLIGGYYGHGNLGDEAILDVMVAALRGAIPGIGITVASGDPTQTTHAIGVDAVDERSWPSLLDAAEGASLIVLGGGGLLHDYHGLDRDTLLHPLHWGLTHCAAFPALADLTHRPFMVSAIGAGPLHTEDGRRYAGALCARAASVTVRDEASRACLIETGVPPETLTLVADPAYLVRPATNDDARACLRRAHVPVGDGPLVAVVLRHWTEGADADRWPSEVAAALDALVEQESAVCVAIPFQADGRVALNDDVAAVAAVRACMRHPHALHVLPSSLPAPVVKAVLGQADVLLAMRLHAVILAASTAVPVVALAYDGKVQSAMDAIGCGHRALPPAQWTGTAIGAAIAAARRDAPTDAPARQDAVRALEARAQKGMRLLVEAASGALSAREAPSDWTVMVAEAQRAALRRAARLEGTLASLIAQRTVDEAAWSARLAEAQRLRAAAEQALLSPSAWWTYQRPRAIRFARRQLGPYARPVLHVARGARARVRRATVAALSAVARRALPAPLRDAVQRRLLPAAMTPHAVVFDTYRRARAARVGGADLSGLRVPGVAGLVSVILPAYNGADLMSEGIESVLAQTYRDLELLIVDDGSTDHTLLVAGAFAARDPRVRVVPQEHLSLPRTLSHGFREARGEFITWTSCDNRMKPDCLATMVESLQRHPQWDMVYANIDIIGDDGAPLVDSDYYRGLQVPQGSAHIHLPHDINQLNVLADNYIGAAFLWRARVTPLLGDHSPYRFMMEDYDYWMRVNALLTLRHVETTAPLYDYRFHGNSLTARWARPETVRRRDRMMVFDDFRRDFYLSPMVWLIDGDAPEAVAEIGIWARAAGHVVTAETATLAELPPLGVPVVHVVVRAHPDGARCAGPSLPQGALRVLATTSAALPTAMAAEWDLCVSLAPDADVPRLDGLTGWLAGTVPDVCHAVDIRARSAYLQALEACGEGEQQAPLAASVVICSHRTSERLVRVLEALAPQVRPRRDVEVIVVDNAPATSGIRTTVAQARASAFAGAVERLRCIDCPIPGLSSARNAGLGAANGDCVLYLDDDAIVQPGWLEAMTAAFRTHASAGVVGGHIRLRVPEPRPSVLRVGWEKYWSQFLTDYTEYQPVHHWWDLPWGANWGARRAALRHIGGFHSRYGRVGGNFWGGEEIVAAILIQRAGYDVGIEPRAVVDHDVDPARYSMEHVQRTMEAGRHASRLMARDLYVPGTGQSVTRRARQLARVTVASLTDAVRRRRRPVARDR